jgi:hypothetical protein
VVLEARVHDEPGADDQHEQQVDELATVHVQHVLAQRAVPGVDQRDRDHRDGEEHREPVPLQGLPPAIARKGNSIEEHAREREIERGEQQRERRERREGGEDDPRAPKSEIRHPPTSVSR